jgi:hypothetical protein
MTTDSCFILARRAKDTQDVKVFISPEDYERVVAIKERWSISSTGYVVTGKRINGVNRLTYLHKEIFGDTCTHINGDRLDNRRYNLTASKKRRRSEPFVLHQEKTQQCEYHDGKKYYGEILPPNIPHGFGMLVESKTRSLGWWHQGHLHSGIVMTLARVPDSMVDDFQVFHPIESAHLIHNHKRLLL